MAAEKPTKTLTMCYKRDIILVVAVNNGCPIEGDDYIKKRLTLRKNYVYFIH